jgi:septum formation protein
MGILESPTIILGSGSPRRRQIFEMLGINFEARTADVDEWSIPYSSPREFAIKAAYAKADAVSKGCRTGAIVVAADTIVTLGDRVYGKPKTPNEARQFLGELSGVWHEVITGMCVSETGKASLLDAVKTRVRIAEMTTQQIAEYVATGEPMDKAGAYAAQGVGRRHIAEIDGDFFNVVGLPVQRLLEMLSQFMDVSEFNPAARQLTRQRFEEAGAPA